MENSILTNVLTKNLTETVSGQQFFQNLINNLPGIFYMFDKDKKEIICNSNFLKLTGIGDSSPEESFISNAVPYDERQLFEEKLEKVIDEGSGSFEFKINCINGKTIPFIATCVVIELHSKSYTAISAVDISEKSHSDNELRKLSRAIEQSPVSVIITNKHGLIEYINPKFTEVTGYASSEAIGRNPRILNSHYHPKKFYKDLWKTILDGQIWEGEFRNIKKDGSLYWEKASISPVRNDKGVITHFVAVKEDVTAAKNMMAELEKAKEAAEASSKTKSAFIANMSHEIRTPMNAILGYSQLMQHDQDISENHRGYLNIIERSGEHLLAIINDILEISKIESGKITIENKSFSLFELVEDMKNMFKIRTDNKNLSFSINYIDDTPEFIVADQGKIRQVLINILGNAVKFTDKGGIDVRIYSIKLPENKYNICFEIEDTGIGISKNELDKVFERFEQTESGRNAGGGTGLGMPISREYARMIKGDILVESERGKGSIFYFDFIAEAGNEIHNFKPTINSISSSQNETVKRNITIIDGNETTRILLKKTLERVGFVIDYYYSIDDFITENVPGRPDIILLDMSLSNQKCTNAVNGILNSKFSKIPLLILTSDIEGKTDSFRDGSANIGYIRKPYREEELFEEIRKLLHIEYVYEEKSHVNISGKYSFRDAVKSCSCLPGDIVKELSNAVTGGDIGELNRLNGLLEPQDEQLSNYIRELADNYDYDKLNELFEEVINNGRK